METVFVKEATRTHGYHLVKHADVCARCGCFVDPQVIAASVKSDDDVIEVIYKCPRNECRGLYIAVFSRPIEKGKVVFSHVKSYPQRIAKKQFDERIDQMSSEFSKIYNQALTAEILKLDQICGVGYRKALEFLVKDFAIYNEPNNATEITKTPSISRILDKYVDDQRITAAAKRAVWLGNDETHYERKWTDKDITDLKNLIELTVHWIVLALMTEQYKNAMPD